MGLVWGKYGASVRPLFFRGKNGPKTPLHEMAEFECGNCVFCPRAGGGPSQGHFRVCPFMLALGPVWG